MMKYILSFCMVWICFLFAQGGALAKTDLSQSYAQFFTEPLSAGEVGIMTLGIHSNVMVRTGGKTVLFDPTILMKTDLEALKTHGVDLVVYTHGHGDHYDKTTALKLFEVCQPHVAIAPELASELKNEIPPGKLIVAASGSSYTAGDITLDALEGKHIGPIMIFRVTIGNIKIFHGGDSAYVDLSSLASDISFVPTGYPSPTCRPKYALKMVRDTRPRIAVAIHGGDSEHEKFMALVGREQKDTRVVIPEPFRFQKLSLQP